MGFYPNEKDLDIRLPPQETVQYILYMVDDGVYINWLGQISGQIPGQM